MEQAPLPPLPEPELSGCCLKWTDSLNRHQIYHLLTEETILGRRSDADLILIERNVSRRHARIVREESGFTLYDLGSAHGTYVNGQRTKQCRLRHGDRIRMGPDGLELVYLLQDQATTSLAGPGNGFDVEKSIQGLASILPRMGSELSNLEKITCILDFHCYWGKTFSPQKTFQQILKSALEISGAERGFVQLKDTTGFRYQAGMNRAGAFLPQSEFRTSHSVARHVAASEKPVFMTERIEGAFAQQESIVAMNLRALACLPLVAIAPQSDDPQVMGILYLDSTKQMHSLSGLDQKIMTKLAEEAGRVLEKLEMIKGIEEQKKIQQELILARETQRSLLPRTLPQSDTLRVHAFSHPTRHVGGDFYDFLTLETGELVGVLADVSGKGVSAALLSSLLQGALHMEFRSSREPAEVLNRINKMLCDRTASNRFVTLFLLLLDAQGKGQFISAGHNPAYLYRACSGQIEELASQGLILGAFDFATYQSLPLQLNDGDVLVVYSDGLTEAENPDGDMFGEERLRQIILQEAGAGSHVLERKLLEAMEKFTRGIGQTDDITFILLEKHQLKAASDSSDSGAISSQETPVPPPRSPSTTGN